MDEFKHTIIEPDLQVNQPKQARELFGVFRTSSAVPTGSPKNFLDQIVFYSNGATYRIYLFDTTNNVWRYATLT